MLKEFMNVRDFQFAFESPVSDIPIQLEPDRKLARSSWMLEKLSEFLKAIPIEDEADALIDLFYLIMGTFVEMGINPQPLFEIVHEANMGKLWPDGKPRFNRQGKIRKPADWDNPEPYLMGEIQKQRVRGGSLL